MRIHKLVLAAIVALPLTTGALDAQENTRTTRFGVLAGFSFADITSSDLSGFLLDEIGAKKEMRRGAQVAAYAIFPMNDRFSIQPEVHYVQKGTTFKVSGFVDDEDPFSNVDVDFNLKLAYLEIPVLARFDLGRAGSAVQPFIVAGPSVALRASCEFGADFGGVGFDANCDNDGDPDAGITGDDVFRKVDYGATVGGGVAFRFFGFPASLQARYNRGLANIGKEQDGIQPEARNTNISVLVGFGFR